MMRAKYRLPGFHMISRKTRKLRFALNTAVLVLLMYGSFASFFSNALVAKPEPEPEMLMIKNAAPRTRVALQFNNDELTQHKLFERRQTLQAYGEYAFTDFFSVHANLPFTRRWLTDTKRQSRLDNIELGAKLAFRFHYVMPYFGLGGNLATGDEEQGIGSRELGNVEPFAGVRLGRDWFFWQIGARYNSQTNKRFRETDVQEFHRFYLIETALVLSFQYVDLLLEYQYKNLRQEEERPGLSSSVIGPGINIKPSENFIIGLGGTYALSREREFDYGYQIRLTYRF